MAFTDELQRLMGYDQGPDNNAEISFKIKPLGSVAATQTPSQPSSVGLGGGVSGGDTPGTGSTSTPLFNLPPGFGTGGESVVPGAQRRTNTNPTLVTHPLGSQTDDIYEAAIAQLAFNTQSRYAQMLQEIGWMNDQGQFMPGTLETEAIRQRSELERQRELGLQNVIENAVRGGTVFSGRRAQLTAQTQQPFDAAIAELGTRLVRELASRYQGLGDLTRQFELGRNQLVAEAAERIKQGLLSQQAGGTEVGANIGGEEWAGIGTGPDYLAGLPAALEGNGIPIRNPGAPPGARLVYNPQVGYYVVNAAGQRIGRLVDGRFVAETPTNTSPRGGVNKVA